ncbi:MAG: hypothetical protein IT225_09345 [Flavobacteriales bacterium]|nr:hypothetical protein [Flavobacteriales bacterium]
MWPFYRRSVVLGTVTGAALSTLAQQNDIPLQRDFHIGVERNAASLNAHTHTGLKPIIQSRADLTGVLGHQVDSSKYYYWISQRIFRDHLLEIRGEDFKLTADPLFQLEYGYEFADRTAYADTNRYYANVRGAWFTGDIGSKLSFQTFVQEHQSIAPQYIFIQARDAGTISGQGRVKLVERRILDYGWSQGNISYTPTSWLNLQFGHGKHFVGHGYRSVLLSDHAVNAPYLKFSVLTPNKRVQYTSWLSKLESGVQLEDRLPTGQSSESLFYWRRGRFNHLSVDLGRVQLALFESTLFEDIDSTGVKPFDALELNPVIGVNTLVRGFDGREKSVVGLDLRLKLTDMGYVYGQFAVDDAGGDRHAYQAGVRWFDVGLRGVTLQVEYNSATPFMYTHDPTKLAYEHAGLPLAHPMGTAFSELLAIADLQFGRFGGQVKVVSATYHRNPSDSVNVGGSLGLPDRPTPGSFDPQVHDLVHLDLHGNYLFNPKTNLRAYIGFQRRGLTNATDDAQSSFIYFGIRTSIFNRYYDI